MSDRDPVYLSHIARAVEAIDRYLSDVTEDAFAQAPMVRDAVLRNLEAVPWRGIAAAGNVYRHEYDSVDHAIVWQTATAGLEPIRKLLETER